MKKILFLHQSVWQRLSYSTKTANKLQPSGYERATLRVTAGGEIGSIPIKAAAR
jgi:hypothetical protein